MSEDAVVAFVERWTPVCEQLGATFFEATTAMAFDYLAAQGVDAGVIEVGLGGRLDSTNVIRPLVAGVVSIGMDHTEYLGHSRELIATEKAGIFKPGTAAVVGERDPALRRYLAELAAGAGATPVRVVADESTITDVIVGPGGTGFTFSDRRGTRRLQTPLLGEHQAANAATALTMLDAAPRPLSPAPDEVARALMEVRLPGRFQWVGQFIFDVAHNPDGVAVLARTLRQVSPPRPLVVLLSVLGDKDWRGMMAQLAPTVDAFVLTSAPTAPASRAWRPDDALAHARGHRWPAEAEPDFDAALARASASGRTVLVTGSFHTVGDAMTRLQVNPLAR